MRKLIISLISLILIIIFSFAVLAGCKVSSQKVTGSTRVNATEPNTTITNTIDSSVTSETSQASSEKPLSDEELLALKGETTNQPQTTTIDKNLNISPDDIYDLLIVTPSEFYQELTVLADFKNNTGIKTKIITLESLYENYEGRDEAEKVKYCLADYKNTSNIKYAMLVGDSDKFPVRYTKADIDAPQMQNYEYFACDIYYANLFKSDGTFDDWDSNKNGYYGELQGSVYIGPVNIDNVDLDPEICVGRIPVSNREEVQNYVSKVINYELNASGADWINNVLLIATTDWYPTAPLDLEDIIKNYLKDKKVYKLYGETGQEEVSEEIAEKMKKDNSFIEETEPINPENVCKYINSGVGFISYIGHGTSDSWYNALNISDLTSLDNPGMLPIAFTAGCNTAHLAIQAPYLPYFDINGISHLGAAEGEVFNDIPPQPACIQQDYNTESIGEVSTVQTKSGFIGYIGCDAETQNYAYFLNNLFFKALSEKKETLGEMWNYAIKEYYIQKKVRTQTTSPDWHAVAEFNQPWKFFLFGDPSLRIGGIKQ